jgi:hypothetical protein
MYAHGRSRSPSRLALAGVGGGDGLNVELVTPAHLANPSSGRAFGRGDDDLARCQFDGVDEGLDSKASGGRSMWAVGSLQAHDHVEMDEASGLELGHFPV